MTSDAMIERQRFLLFGLLQGCPLKKNMLKKCPLLELRENMSLEEKLHYSETIEVPALLQLIADHDACFFRECQNL